MKINFTKKQMKDLLTLVEAGNWVINSFRDEPIEQYEDLYNYILNAAHQMNMPEVIYDKESDQAYLTHDAEEEIHEFISEYDDYTFWDELALNLAKRDYANEMNVRNDTREEAFLRIIEFEEKYAEEFYKNGLKNLVIKSKK